MLLPVDLKQNKPINKQQQKKGCRDKEDATVKFTESTAWH